MRVIALISGGKDSCYSVAKCKEYGHEIVAVANLHPPTPTDVNKDPNDGDEIDSYTFQTVGFQGVEYIAESLGVPLFRSEINSHKFKSINTNLVYETTDPDDEVEVLFELIKRIKNHFNNEVDAVCSGAILSDYQRLRIEHVCDRLGLVSLSYLWQRDQKELLKEMIDYGMNSILIKVAAMGLNEKHLAKSIGELYPFLLSLEKSYGINVCGEGGEYETFTLDCPVFNKRIVFEEKEVVFHSRDPFAPVVYLRPTKIRLEDKDEPPKSFQIQPHLSAAPQSSTTPTLNDSNIDKISIQVFGTLPWLHIVGTVIEEGTTIANDVHRVLTEIQNTLTSKGSSMKDVYFVFLHVNDMDQFATINSSYKPFFAFPNPPSRACVGCTLAPNQKVIVECLAFINRTPKALHVQSISCWAPACIGPYSQASNIDIFVHLAGMIALDPPTMKLVSSSIEDETNQVLKNTAKVLPCADTLINNILVARFYVTQADTIDVISRLWSEWLDAAGAQNKKPILTFFQVPSLPRGARVELQLVNLNKSETAAIATLERHSEVDGALKIESLTLKQKFGFITVGFEEELSSQVIEAAAAKLKQYSSDNKFDEENGFSVVKLHFNSNLIEESRILSVVNEKTSLKCTPIPSPAINYSVLLEAQFLARGDIS